MEQMYQCGGNTNMDKSTCDYCEYQNEQHYEYCDDYTCNDYYTYCSDMYGDDNEVDLSDFLECSEYTNDYDQTYYIGPHCGDDHFKISIGVFSDENCLNYIGETVTLASVLGFGWNDDDLFKLPKECISCDGTVSNGQTLTFCCQEFLLSIGSHQPFYSFYSFSGDLR